MRSRTPRTSRTFSTSWRRWSAASRPSKTRSSRSWSNFENAQRDLGAVTSELSEIGGLITEAEGTRDKAFGEIDAQLAELTAERELTAKAVPDDLLALYGKLRSQYGVGAAALRQRRCEGCRLELNAADLREIAAEPADAVLRCPECSRILVRTSESGL
ncbi:zinc ribbon domain-containing protein [Solicola gregarius]|uniref:C4-type zinc ribbon domain-containing protein n=1 Tax=Solicola gregarius TaxID=2908642 RepID=A0AA46YLK3_9ACTN|nr:C4-type zinc ribbon domain-containing protein [Solicola gregarius]UYM05591.1 C4-type zinc ribbon domain-containing protein [Solicola gregarius]